MMSTKEFAFLICLFGSLCWQISLATFEPALSGLGEVYPAISEDHQLSHQLPLCDPKITGHLCEPEVHSFLPYAFGYSVKDSYHGTSQSREETADGYGSVKGSYSYIDPHGLKRVVDYVADKAGFRATVQTNEPGTETSSPAAASILSSAPKLDISHLNYPSLEAPYHGGISNLY